MAFNYFSIKSGTGGSEASSRIESKQHAVGELTKDLTGYHPNAVLLFGSMARYLAGYSLDAVPGDMDILMVGNSVPFAVESKDYGCDIELHIFKNEEMINIAKILRYDAKPIALSKLYSKVVLKNHSRDIIAACLLLGPEYNDFGIEQIEVDSLIDRRDYSAHKILYGEKWWWYLSEYARERRGALKRFSDKIVGRYEFEDWKLVKIACEKGDDTACSKI
ncbi:MAG: hypothetical protein ACOC23_02025 [Thermodesulfobacteriota bacterium]